jgi:hypothetical protein
MNASSTFSVNNQSGTNSVKIEFKVGYSLPSNIDETKALADADLIMHSKAYLY